MILINCVDRNNYLSDCDPKSPTTIVLILKRNSKGFA
jgi:hypothetical protein